MKALSLTMLISIFIFSISYSQITILSTDIGTTSDTTRYSHTSLLLPNNVEVTDSNYFWDFSNLTANFQSTKEYQGLNSVPLIYKIAFYG